ncbi:TonB-dependent receptor [Novosphingobium sp. MD-1]|uniref:TonB-dependent receptor n=1 Tax=Novosphingobium sp. MD-1 TaxID=1630648 RepID=UPI000F7D7116|nr:TonB-dependent receptor [Novosphingobium sp. MD-1]
MKRFHGNACVMAIALGTLPATAYAEAGDADPQTGQLGEIIVTAERVSQSQQKTPLAIDVVTADDLAIQRVTRAEDLSRTSPALATIGGSGGTTTFYLRGVGNNTVNAYSDPAIAFNYDGVYIGRPSSTSGMFYDLARVEVLKGPQGTLYGRNATGGAINVIPNRPKLNSTGGEVSAGYGNYNWLTLQGAVNLPLGENVAIRAAGNLSRHDAFLSDGTGNQREAGARVQIYAEPSAALDVRLAFDYAHQGGASASGYYVGAVNPTFGPTGFAGYNFVPSGFSTQQGTGDPASQGLLASRFLAQAGRAGAVQDGRPSNDNNYWGVTAELNYKTDAGTLTIQPAWREANLDYVFTNIFRESGSKEKDRQASVEARWAGSLGKQLDYLIGGIYYDERISASAWYNQWTLSPFQNFKTSTESWAGFGKVTFKPVEGLSLTAAGRYTSDRKTFNGTSQVYLLFCGQPGIGNVCPNTPLIPRVQTAADVEAFYAANGVPITNVPLFVLPPFAGGSTTAPFVLRSPIPVNSGLRNNKFTYRLAAQYDFSPRNMVYASFETGYHAGGFTFARGLESYAPETLDAYTIGSKNRFFGNKLQVNLEGFIWKYRNQQFSQFGYDLGNPPSTVFLTRNIGNSTIKGFDLDVELLAATDTLLSGSVQYLDTSYDSFVYYVPNQGLPPNTACPFAPTTQTTPGGTINVYAINCSGRPAFNAPKWSVTLNGQQTFHLDTLKLVLQANTRFRSSTFVSADYLSYLKAPANFVTTLSVTLAEESDRWSITGYVFNVENNQRIVNPFANSANLIVANAEQPRTYGIRAAFKF